MAERTNGNGTARSSVPYPDTALVGHATACQNSNG